LAGYFAAYHPDFVLCDGFALRWPFYLRKDGWRPIFYAPNGSVWTRPGTRPDLPTLTAAEVQTAFDAEIARGGSPRNFTLYGRNLIVLHAMGLSDFAFARLAAVPPTRHSEPWYWEAARIMCFEEPRASQAIRDRFEAEALSTAIPPEVTAEFRAYDAYAEQRIGEAKRILQAIPPAQLRDAESLLLLRIEVETHDPGALALARRVSLFDLRDGEHWRYLAELEDRAGQTAAAAAAWKRAVFYQPDVPLLLSEASLFAARTGNAALARQASEATIPYGFLTRR
jgi:hypothetical protein